MDTIIGIGIYPLISFVLFFTFFVLMLIWLRKVGRSHVDHMAALPITEEFSTLEIEHNDH
ncbi:MAG: CcoQ/FixQ family Cbb3-type cytochrome c oxidase assembly chaperone [Flavobacteriales bacterium]